MALTSVTELVELLRRSDLLEGPCLDTVTAELQDRFSEPLPLAKELIQRGWLTPYQVNHLFQGKDKELTLGNYVLLERLGEGGMGAVFKARHRRLGRLVALKLIRKESLGDDDAVRRFRREIRAASQLTHPHIVMALDADEADGVHFYAMEYVEGCNLAQWVEQHGPLPVRRACEYVRQAALGLQHAHERGLVHRDVKPSNLLLTTQGETIKLLDLGLARLRRAASDGDSGSSLTQIGEVMGTPDYISPEQAESSHTVDIRADLYSLGCTLYFLLAGRAPFSGLVPIEKLFHHRYHMACPIEDHRSEVPLEVATVVRKLMEKKPEHRYQTPAELVAALDEVIAKLPPDPEPAPGAVRAPETVLGAPFVDMTPTDPRGSRARAHEQKRSEERRRWFWLNAAGGLFLLGLVAVFLVLLLFR
jgi:serine/threonine protein kinase